MIAPTLILVLLVGSLVYCVLTALAARSYRSQTRRLAAVPRSNTIPISILRPLAGRDNELEQNLRSGFEQDYPRFEMLFAVRRADDPAVEVVQKLEREYPSLPVRLIVTGEPPCPNAKVFSLWQMAAESRYEVLVMVDSDIRLSPEMLQCMAAEFEVSGASLITCPYRAVPGPSLWSVLEAIGLNTEFLGGVLVARMLNGMDFAVGCAIAARRDTIESIGGFDRLKNYLAEDFVMGNLVAKSGFRILLSSYIIEHHIGAHKFRANISHRLRWARSTRRSRRLGYVGQVFTHPLPLALALCLLRPGWWPLLPLTLLARAAAAWCCAGLVLHDPLTRRYWWLLPIQDLAGFIMWVAGFFGSTVVWRNRAYRLQRDGRLEPLPHQQAV